MSSYYDVTGMNHSIALWPQQPHLSSTGLSFKPDAFNGNHVCGPFAFKISHQTYFSSNILFPLIKQVSTIYLTTMIV